MAGPFDSWTPAGGSADAEVRALLRAVMGLHSSYKDEVWLWRGQASGSFPLAPAMHSRVLRTKGLRPDEANVRWATADLIRLARERRFDSVEELILPDLALLAHLQHHGAATPLLDVTVDPLVGLWMVVNATASNPGAMDGELGHLFAIRRPPEDRWIDALDSRPYWTPADTDADISSLLDSGLHWYRPPEISERLRIQRGSFVLGRLKADNNCSLEVTYKSQVGWLATRVGQLGKQGAPAQARTDVVAFRIPPRLKGELRGWLADRAGLTPEVVFPTPWHRPFLEEFCRNYGRGRPIDHGMLLSSG